MINRNRERIKMLASNMPEELMFFERHGECEYYIYRDANGDEPICEYWLITFKNGKLGLVNKVHQNAVDNWSKLYDKLASAA